MASVGCYALALFGCASVDLLAAEAPAKDSESGFKYRIAIVGCPALTDTRYDDTQLQALKDKGFNAIQLNIAWGARPGDEALNLEDILADAGQKPTPRMAQRFEEIRRRAQRAKAFGFRTLFHFGAPNIGRLYTKLANYPQLDRDTEANSITNPAVITRHQYLLTALARGIPEIDDILIYTYDQEAWLGDQFSNDKTARGIPIAERVPQFLSALCETWREHHPDGIMWWEPWEISAGQGMSLIDQLPVRNFGLMLHSNIGEVQASRPVDTWFRSLTELARRRGIPVVGEGFLGSANEEVDALVSVPVPALAHLQLQAFRSVEGLAGVKEYFGLLPDRNDPTLEMTALCFREPDINLTDALGRLVVQYGSAGPAIIDSWRDASLAYQLMPWDVTWLLRKIWAYGPRNYLNKRSYHGWEALKLRGLGVRTPANWANRRSTFVIMADEQVHNPWLLEDIGLRFGSAADYFDRSIGHLRQALPHLSNGDHRRDVGEWINDLFTLKIVCRDRSLHALETIAAYNIRRYLDEKMPVPAHLYERLEKLLETDVSNQAEFDMTQSLAASAAEMLGQYRRDRDQWVKEHFIYPWPADRKVNAIYSEN